MFMSIAQGVIHVMLICFFFLMAFSFSLFILAGNLDHYILFVVVIFGHFLGELNFLSFLKEDVNKNLEFYLLTFYLGGDSHLAGHSDCS